MKALSSIAAPLLFLGLAAAAAAQDKKPTPVTVAYSATSGTFSPLWVAADQGLFAKHGLDVRVTYIQGNRVLLAYVQSRRDGTLKAMAKYTRQRDRDVLEKYYEELILTLPRIPYVEDASALATVEAMQLQGPPLPKVDPKTLYDNSLLKRLESAGFVDKIYAR
ncbi:MAG TPA: hypothetical protein VGL11_12480 [Candidatus Binatia bacterium]|jgi:hypothetical protein